MAETGADYAEGAYGLQDANEDKNHNRGATIPSSIQPGMLFSRSSDDRLTHKASAQNYLIFQGDILCADNEVLCADNEVLVALSV